MDLMLSVCFFLGGGIIFVNLYRRITERRDFWIDDFYCKDDLHWNPLVKLLRIQNTRLTIALQEIRGFYATRFGKIVCNLWIGSIVIALAITAWSIYVDISSMGDSIAS
ncbi:hypothetical protein FHS21_002818 [Phyllobacterium trifolii]|uniref:Uncharacterized protein n=1 Tax=Phyllobacterium trifolii TaxID=300193 RepID=A0A839U927_9HYPH|nr:hypothetical protein [Phyllobacterium trifolii]